MVRRLNLKTLVTAAAAATALAACTPVTSYHGFQAIEAKPSDVKVGEDTKATVTERLGSASIVSTFDPNVWFYVSQVTDRVAFYRPQVQQRDIVALAFDPQTETVTAVNTYTLKDGKVIAFNERETPTRGREMTILEQLLGNVGRGGLLPEDVDPGQRPGGGQR